MRRFLPGIVKCGVKAIWSRVIEWLREWTRPDNHGLVGGAVADATRSKSELMLENALLRQQLIVLDRQVKRPQLSWRDQCPTVNVCDLNVQTILANRPAQTPPRNMDSVCDVQKPI